MILDEATEAALVDVIRKSAIDYFVEQAEIYTLASTLERGDQSAIYQQMKDRLPELPQALLLLVASAIEAGDIGIRLSQLIPVPDDEPADIPIPNKNESFFMLDGDIVTHFKAEGSEFVMDIALQPEAKPLRCEGNF